MVELPNTGERAMPGPINRTALEHLHRYALASAVCAGKAVLDVASGEGYGAHQLAEVAASVVGVELSPDAVRHAQNRYRRANLRFIEGDLESLPLSDGEVECVTCFETLEHVHDQSKALGEIKRVLGKNGVCLISTPCRETYNLASGEPNKFHTHELEIPEFRALLETQFQCVAIYAQRVTFASIVVPEAEEQTLSRVWAANFDAVKRSALNVHPIYALAVASDGELPFLMPSLMEHSAQLADPCSELTEHWKHEAACSKHEAACWKHEAESLRESTSFRIGQKIIGPLHKILRRTPTR